MIDIQVLEAKDFPEQTEENICVEVCLSDICEITPAVKISTPQWTDSTLNLSIESDNENQSLEVRLISGEGIHTKRIIGRAAISINSLDTESPLDTWIQLTDENDQNSGQVHLIITKCKDFGEILQDVDQEIKIEVPTIHTSLAPQDNTIAVEEEEEDVSQQNSEETGGENNPFNNEEEDLQINFTEEDLRINFPEEEDLQIHSNEEEDLTNNFPEEEDLQGTFNPEEEDLVHNFPEEEDLQVNYNEEGLTNNIIEEEDLPNESKEEDFQNNSIDQEDLQKNLIDQEDPNYNQEENNQINNEEDQIINYNQEENNQINYNEEDEIQYIYQEEEEVEENATFSEHDDKAQLTSHKKRNQALKEYQLKLIIKAKNYPDQKNKEVKDQIQSDVDEIKEQIKKESETLYKEEVESIFVQDEQRKKWVNTKLAENNNELKKLRERHNDPQKMTKSRIEKEIEELRSEIQQLDEYIGIAQQQLNDN